MPGEPCRPQVGRESTRHPLHDLVKGDILYRTSRRARGGVVALATVALPLALLHPAAAFAATDPTTDPATDPAAQPAPAEGSGILDHDRFVIGFEPTAPETDALEGADTDADAVELFEDDTRAALVASAEKQGATVVEGDPTTGETATITLSEALDEAEIEAFVTELEQVDGIAYVEPDIVMTANRVNDPQYPSQWSLAASAAGIDVETAWRYTTGEGVTVAVLDTGIVAHPDLDGTRLPGYDFITRPEMSRDRDGRDANPQDEGDWMRAGACGGGEPRQDQASSWHGSHVGGIIAAQANNGEGIAGVAHGAKHLPVRVLGMCGGMSSDIAAGIIWAAGGSVPGVPANPNPAQVINMSLGGTSATCPRVYQDAIDEATRRGAIVVVAAGNETMDASRATPANCRNVITVGATGPTAAQSYFSNFGQKVTVSAPGGDVRRGDAIRSTVDSGRTTPAGAAYGSQQGTSQASPHVAGTVALLKALKPELTFSEAVSYLTRTATPLSGCSGGCGAGIIDAGAAVTALANDLGTTPGNDGTPTTPPTTGPSTPPTTTTAPQPSPSPTTTTAPQPTQPTQPSKPSVSMSKTRVAKGERVTVSATGFAPGERVSFFVDSTNYRLSTLTADSSGTIRASWTVPYDLLRGSHVLYAVSMTDYRYTGTWFRIV